MRKEYLSLDRIEGPLIVLSGVEGAFYGEIIEIDSGEGRKRTGKIIRIENDTIVAQVFEGTSGLVTSSTSVRLTGKPFEIKVSHEILGRTFNGTGRPIDGSGPVFSSLKRNINGRPINPIARKYPRSFIQTGVSSIDSLITLIRGQKLPIFSGNGLPHNELAAQIVRQAQLGEGTDEEFAVVFAAIGVKNDDAAYFRRSFEDAGALDRVVFFLNLADDPVVERISTPRCALTAAEYLAFEEGINVLVVMTDITSYCEALREISSSREEVPSRKGYPGYLYSDLASLYERAGMMKGQSGSITFLPILTMPNDDISHPIPDLTGFITEGQIVLGRDLHQDGVFPPVAVLPSLSRLMKDGIGKGYTREDHADVANQLFSCYSRVQEVRALAQIIGESDLSELDKKYLTFGRAFEGRFLGQGDQVNRSITDSLELGWDLLAMMPRIELSRIDDKFLDEHYDKRVKA